MSNDLFPAYPEYRGLAFTVMRAPEFNTIVQEAPSSVETRILRIQNPRWRWTLQYNYLKDDIDDLPPDFIYTDFKTLLAFIENHKGRFADFLLRDSDDDYVGPAMASGSPNTKAQLQLIQDPVTGTWYSPIQRRMGGRFYEDITDINGAITLYANGVFQGESNYVIGGPGLGIAGHSFLGLYAEWLTEPATPITAEFYFYWRVRLDSDKQDLDKFMHDLWAIGGGQGSKGSGTLQLITMRNSSSGYTGGYPPPPISQFPEAWAYWKLDEASGTRLDATGHAHHGNPYDETHPTVNPEPTYLVSTPGKLGNGVQFSNAATGSPAPCLRIDNPSTALDFSNGFTISFWWRYSWPTGQGANTTYGPLYFESWDEALNIPIVGTNYGEVYISFTTNYGTKGFWDIYLYTDNNNGEYLEIDYDVYPNNILDPDVWGFICIYHDGVGLHLEVNNVEVGFASGPSGLDTISCWPLGDWYDNLNIQNRNSLDEVGIWLTALTAEQRAQLWNNGAGWSPY